MARQARCWAMNALARREHSELEILQKLQDKGCDKQQASATVRQLVADGLISDARFTEGIVRYRRNRGMGPVRIARELSQKGVQDTIIEQWLDARQREWFEAAVHARKKKFGAACPDSYDARARQARFLQYRGFNFDQIEYALKSTEA